MIERALGELIHAVNKKSEELLCILILLLCKSRFIQSLNLLFILFIYMFVSLFISMNFKTKLLSLTE